MPRVQRPTLERVIARLDTTGDCWEWTGAAFYKGYGNVRHWNGERWTNKGAHIVMYEAAYGPVPDGLFVCHHCDNPPCCRPSHLFVGTQRDNLRDAARKGRAGRKRDSASGRFTTSTNPGRDDQSLPS